LLCILDRLFEIKVKALGELANEPLVYLSSPQVKEKPAQGKPVPAESGNVGKLETL